MCFLLKLHLDDAFVLHGGNYFDGSTLVKKGTLLQNELEPLCEQLAVETNFVLFAPLSLHADDLSMNH